MTADTPVGIVGLGLMGVALSARLVDAKIPLVGFDIDPVRCGMFKATGGMVATSVRELAARCQTIGDCRDLSTTGALSGTLSR